MFDKDHVDDSNMRRRVSNPRQRAERTELSYAYAPIEARHTATAGISSRQYVRTKFRVVT